LSTIQAALGVRGESFQEAALCGLFLPCHHEWLRPPHRNSNTAHGAANIPKPATHRHTTASPPDHREAANAAESPQSLHERTPPARRVCSSPCPPLPPSRIPCSAHVYKKITAH